MAEAEQNQVWKYRWIKGSSGFRDLDSVMFFNPQIGKNILFTFADLKNYLDEGKTNFQINVPKDVMQAAMNEYFAEEQKQKVA